MNADNDIITMPIEHSDYPISCEVGTCPRPATHFSQTPHISWFQCDFHYENWIWYNQRMNITIVQKPPIGIHFTPIDEEPTKP